MVIIGKVSAINTSDSVLNLGVYDKDKNGINLKIETDRAQNIEIGLVYEFEYKVVEGERTSYWVTAFTSVDDFQFEKKESVLRDFYPASPLSYLEAKNELQGYLNKIDNKIVYDITCNLVKKYEESIYLYPAATKMHHAYIGGLAHHCIGMLKMADSFLANYPYLDKNFIYAGVILHDIGKIMELTGPINTEYSIHGQLLGHLVIGAMEINNEAIKLGYENTDEVLHLCHLLVSHHGVPQFGSAKKPMTAEAWALWYIDTIDSKFRVLGEELDEALEQSFTGPIGVLDRSKIYKF